MTCPDCTRATLALARLRAKHKQYAAQTNALLTEQANEITALRTALEERPQ
ncbi:MAG TPA: hypothetical protein VNS81_00175 [Nocardioides sp.]|nr:hypothetical protein [Nocardioides sp.]